MNDKEKIEKTLNYYGGLHQPLEDYKPTICIEMKEYKELLSCKGYKEAYILLINSLKICKISK